MAFRAVIREGGEQLNSLIRLIRECVCGYFYLVNRWQGVGQAGPVAMYICVYMWMHAYEGKESKRLSERNWVGGCHWRGICRQIQNIKQAITAIRRMGCPPASAELSLLPTPAAKELVCPGPVGQGSAWAWGHSVLTGEWDPLPSQWECSTRKHYM